MAKPASEYGEVRIYRRNSDHEIDREALRDPEDYKPALSRLLSRNSSVTDPVVEVVPNWTNVTQFLNVEWQRKLVVSDLQLYLTEELNSSLSPSDCELFEKHGLAIPDEPSRQRIYNAIDDIILQGAIEQGPKILLLPTVFQRVSDWVLADEDNGERWKELGKCFALLARVVRGKARAPLYPWWVRSRRAIIEEVQALKKQLRAEQPKHSGLSKRALLHAALNTIEENHSRFPKILRIGVPFQGFLESEIGVLRRLLQGTLTPADFAGQLIQWATNYKPESSRQIISHYLAKPKRKL